jgi:3-hydroxybutyryl-CoA dehydrogenase
MTPETLPPPAGARIGVVGGGTMGVGIGYVFAMAGFPVALVEPDAERGRAALAMLKRYADAGIARGKIEPEAAAQRLSTVAFLSRTEDLPEGLNLVVETVPERRDLKLAVLAGIDSRAPALIATNTSALSIADLASAVADPSRFLGMHFFNPVPSLMLVELAYGERTSPESLALARGFAAAIGKATITVRDVPGFATSRLDLVQAMEAIRMVETGVASPQDIDLAATTAYRHPVGPLRLSDMVGLDVRLDIARQLAAALGPHFAPPRLLEEMVARGDLGRKSGSGFYEWPTDAPAQRG